MSVFFNCFIKGNLIEEPLPRGSGGVMSPPAKRFIGTGVSKRPELITEVCK